MFSRIRKAVGEYKEIKYLAYHDSLTGLLNRNWLHKNLNILRHFKYVYFIDINDLRFHNKNGHTFGDIHIKMVISTIFIIDDDILIRYAGDEFLLFSNKYNRISTNTLMAVGYSEITDDVLQAINKSDYNMGLNKHNYKCNDKY